MPGDTFPNRPWGKGNSLKKIFKFKGQLLLQVDTL
ncbi:uncharacterized protein METZ01_LOCUS230771 [marine metagenome]|uniref:Uncharacterized protein n=1 Tax=marine metagenome TaxID=408172 RepID=A0A382GTB5_9ZZZZ